MCHIPQGPNNELHPKFRGLKTDCPAPDLLLPLAFGMLHFDVIIPNDAHATVKAQIRSEAEMIQYLNGPPHENQPTNLVLLFLKFAKDV